MKSEERKRKRKQKKRSSSMGSNMDDKPMDEVPGIVDYSSESESSGSDSSYDLCKDIDNIEKIVVPAEYMKSESKDIDNIEKNVVPAENVKGESGSEGMSSDYDFCDLDEKDSIDESMGSPKAESSVVVSDTGVDDGSVDESMKNYKVESSNVTSDIGGAGVEKSSNDENLKISKGSLSTASDIVGVEEDFVDEAMKNSKAESSSTVNNISVVQNDSIDVSVKSPAESTRVVSDIGGVEKDLSGAVSDVGGVSKGSMQIFIRTLTGKTITLEAESSDTINKVSTNESLKISKDNLSGGVSEGSEDTGDVSEPKSDSDVESQGSENTEGDMYIDDYYDEQLAEVAERPLLVPNYEQLCTNYQEFKAMLLKNIIMEHALPYLPAKSLTRFRSISKAWDMWIQSSFLAHQQSHKFRHLSGYFHELYPGFVSFTSLSNSSYGVPNPYVDFLPVDDKMTVVGASNGLLLCKTTAGALTYCVCNPATKKWKMLPQPRFYHGEKPAIAFAFVPSVLNIEAHYELVCAFPRLDEPVLSLEIYSSLTKEWRCIDSLCSELAKSKFKSSGFYFNGVAYWETESNEVLAFDIESGIHGVLPLPSGVTASGALGQMGGEVCYVSAQKTYNRIFEISVYAGMNMDLKRSVKMNLGSRGQCGVPRSWNDDGEDEEYCRVMPFFTDDMVTLLVDGCFYVCDINKEMVKTVLPDGSLHADASYWPYVNSLVCV